MKLKTIALTNIVQETITLNVGGITYSDIAAIVMDWDDTIFRLFSSPIKGHFDWWSVIQETLSLAWYGLDKQADMQEVISFVKGNSGISNKRRIREATEVRNLSGLSADLLFERYRSKMLYIYRQERDFVRSSLESLSVKGSTEFVRNIHSSGIPIFALTINETLNESGYVDIFGLNEQFSAVIDAQTPFLDIQGKRIFKAKKDFDKVAVLKGLKRHYANKGNILFISDGARDYREAQAAKVAFLPVIHTKADKIKFPGFPTFIKPPTYFDMITINPRTN